MEKLRFAIKKDYLNMRRSRRFLAIALGAPFIIMLTVVLVFAGNSSVNLTVGLVDHTEEFSSLSSSKDRSVTFTSFDNETLCKQAVINLETHGCVVVSKNAVDATKREVVLYADYTDRLLVWRIIGVVSGIVEAGEKKTSYSIIKALSDQVGKVGETADSTEEQLAVIKESIQKNIVTVRSVSTTTTTSKDIEEFGNQLQATKSDLGEKREQLEDIQTDIREADENVVRYQNKTNESLNRMKQIQEKLDSEVQSCQSLSTQASSLFSSRSCTSTDLNVRGEFIIYSCANTSSALQSTVDSMASDLQCLYLEQVMSGSSRKAQYIEEEKRDIDDAVLQLEEIDAQLRETHEQLVSMDQAITEALEDLETTERNIDSAIVTVNTVETEQTKKTREVETFKTEAVDDLTSANRAIENIEGKLVDLKKTTAPKSAVSPDIVSPFQMNVEPIIPVNEERRKLTFIIPTLFALLTMISSVILSSTYAVYEKKLNAFTRNFLSPTNKSLFSISILLTTTAVTFVQGGIFFMILVILHLKGMLVLALPQSLPAAFVLLLFSLFAFCSIGLFIANVFKSEHSTTIGVVGVIILLLIISNVLIPIEEMGSAVRLVAMSNPLTLLSLGLKQSLMFGKGIIFLLPIILKLVAVTVIFTALADYLNRQREVS